MVCEQSDQSVIGRAKHFRDFKSFRHERYLRCFFFLDTNYVGMSCTGKEIGLVELALRC